MSFDIAKYPTLALVDSTQELRLLPKESLPKLCDELRRYLLDIADATRRHPSLSLGVSPRGVLALQRAARAHAASLGSPFVRPDDIKSLAVHILPHRLLPTPEARLRGITPAQVVTQILDGVAVPQGNAS